MLHAKGSLLSIDLTEQETLTETIDDILASFTGGRGAATKLVHERVPFDADLLGPENRVVFTTGPLQLSNMSFTGRMNATTVSPLTDGLLSSNAGGFMSRNFAATGYGAIEHEGMALLRSPSVPELKRGERRRIDGQSSGHSPTGHTNDSRKRTLPKVTSGTRTHGHGRSIVAFETDDTLRTGTFRPLVSNDVQTLL